MTARQAHGAVRGRRDDDGRRPCGINQWRVRILRHRHAATPSSRRRVDGVDDDAMIQHAQVFGKPKTPDGRVLERALSRGRASRARPTARL